MLKEQNDYSLILTGILGLFYQILVLIDVYLVKKIHNGGSFTGQDSSYRLAGSTVGRASEVVDTNPGCEYNLWCRMWQWSVTSH